MKKEFFLSSLKVKITIFFLFIITLPFFIFLYLGINKMTETSVELISHGLYEKSNIVTRLIDQFFVQQIERAETLAKSDIINRHDHKEVVSFLEKVLKKNSAIKSIRIYDDKNMQKLVIAEKPQNEPMKKITVDGVPIESYLLNKPLKADEYIISDALFLDGTISVFIVISLEDAKRLLFTEIGLENISFFLNDFDDELEGDKYVYLLNKKNEVVLTQDPEVSSLEVFHDSKADTGLKKALENIQNINSVFHNHMTYTDHKNDKVIASFSLTSEFGKNRGLGYRLVSVASIEAITRPVYDIKDTLIIIGTIIILLSLIFAFLVLGNILNPIKQMVQFAKKFSLGDYKRRIETKGLDYELFLLSKTLNSMAEGIEARDIELSEKNRELEKRVEIEVSKQRKQEQVMLEQSKMAAMGEMLGNIAHQWRQPISAINLVMANLKDAYSFGKLDESAVNRAAEKIDRLVHKMSSTIDDFRNFFRQDKESHDFYITEIINDTLSIMDAALKSYNINIVNKVDPSHKIHGYPNEFSQVILNIINNSKDAFLEKNTKGAVIEISSSVIGGETRLELKDNAGGIPQVLLKRIFEPYFTTKHQSHGTGIGLYMSKIIIEDHMGGKLLAANDENGAVFSIIVKNQ